MLLALRVKLRGRQQRQVGVVCVSGSHRNDEPIRKRVKVSIASISADGTHDSIAHSVGESEVAGG